MIAVSLLLPALLAASGRTFEDPLLLPGEGLLPQVGAPEERVSKVPS
jgi:hypothetical protein